ncbi:hypothetical protein [Ichthyenterobacterium magnum]|uniref:Adhesin n=1 Tax=Ichthyenterobacterium magnum TaxID=1230530 RepID=A0A420DX97_9FLAO|nr:hypothetical protein [Ichthyenterobacterium magnum]RKE98811.1 hypothetical protein BXY80_0906 [Ichthyenterobacterium magnum]
MMANLFYKTVVCGVLVLLSYSMQGQNKLSKEIKQTHPLTNNGALYIENKYGDIYLNGWEKNEIEIVVTIEANGKNLEKAQELLSLINSNIAVSNKQIIVKSEISQKKTGFFNKYINKIDPFKNEKTNTVIDYTIMLPKATEVEIFNKYGDVIISDWNGKLKTTVEHGDIRLLDSITNSNLSIKYGKLRASTLYKTNVLAKDASISINSSNNLKLESNGSEITLDVIGSLDLNSNKDNIEINQLNNVFGTLKYSTTVFNNVSKKVNLDLNLTELRLLKFNTAYPNIDINQKSSEVYINISETNFKFDAKLEQGVLRIPKSLHNINSDVIDKKDKIRHITASYKKEGSGTLYFKGEKGVIILKEL